MKTFKEFNKDKPPKIPKKKESNLGWDSGHKEARDKKKLKEDYNAQNSIGDDSHVTENGNPYNGHFHDDPDVKPQKLSETHKNAIHNYCSTPSDHKSGHASSQNMNNYLRNRDGEKDKHVLHHNEKDVESSILKLSSAFWHKENTNKKPIETYGGIPHHIGEKLEKSGKGATHHLSGFTSTSSSQKTATDYGHGYKNQHSKNPTHVIKYNIHPGAGLSAVHHSRWSENEVILHHGAKIKYSHTTKHDDGYGGDVKVHHVTVHPDHKKLSEYGKYDE